MHVSFFFLLDLRSTLDAQGAHTVHAHLTHIHALVADLDHATLEVLLVEHVHLEGHRSTQVSQYTNIKGCDVMN